ncbi:hypothetical protein NQ176_g7033 [Zarea fungicola]|uniref:Uncharacterized protein n=1 Tax=Zarea fungicola TaxID=93591 RepID=A0ACC1N064_9HYPO|nr:hypothetical protein NQ176_g7033 [Lecanicillium fungicola]
MIEGHLPFCKPELSEEAIEAAVAVLRSGWLTSGPKVTEFEDALSEYFGGRPTRTFSSGTSSLEVALRVAGVGEGSEVITTPLSWVATANVILSVRATPVFVDVDPRTRNMNLDLVEQAITDRTKAILPVHLAGRPVDMDQLYDLARRHHLRVVEDAAQALGSKWKGKRIGSFGDLVSFSFQATKNITTGGEGGCIVLNNESEATLAEKIRLQGLTRTGYEMDVDVLGGKHNMTDVAAAIGLCELSRLDSLGAKRRRLAEMYFTAFGVDFEKRWHGAFLPLHDTGDFESNWHLFQLILPPGLPRAAFQEAMKTRFQIGTGCHYPAIHLFQLYRDLGFKEGMLPVAEQSGKAIVTLPLFPAMDEDDVKRVVNAIENVFESHFSS